MAALFMLLLAATMRPSAAAKLGVSFTPGGLCYPYQIGVAKHLYERGVLRPDVPIAGASSGGIVAAIAALSETGGPSIDDTFDAALLQFFRDAEKDIAAAGDGAAVDFFGESGVIFCLSF